MTEDELNEIERKWSASQKGPWKAFIEGRDHQSGSSFIMVGDEDNRSEDIELINATKEDYDFIASAKQDIPKLIAEIRRLKKS